jgi:hypothetical protein
MHAVTIWVNPAGESANDPRNAGARALGGTQYVQNIFCH